MPRAGAAAVTPARAPLRHQRTRRSASTTAVRGYAAGRRAIRLGSLWHGARCEEPKITAEPVSSSVSKARPSRRPATYSIGATPSQGGEREARDEQAHTVGGPPRRRRARARPGTRDRAGGSRNRAARRSRQACRASARACRRRPGERQLHDRTARVLVRDAEQVAISDHVPPAWVSRLARRTRGRHAPNAQEPAAVARLEPPGPRRLHHRARAVLPAPAARRALGHLGVVRGRRPLEHVPGEVRDALRRVALWMRADGASPGGGPCRPSRAGRPAARCPRGTPSPCRARAPPTPTLGPWGGACRGRRGSRWLDRNRHTRIGWSRLPSATRSRRRTRRGTPWCTCRRRCTRGTGPRWSELVEAEVRHLGLALVVLHLVGAARDEGHAGAARFGGLLRGRRNRRGRSRGWRRRRRDGRWRRGRRRGVVLRHRRRRRLGACGRRDREQGVCRHPASACGHSAESTWSRGTWKGNGEPRCCPARGLTKVVLGDNRGAGQRRARRSFAPGRSASPRGAGPRPPRPAHRAGTCTSAGLGRRAVVVRSSRFAEVVATRHPHARSLVEPPRVTGNVPHHPVRELRLRSVGIGAEEREALGAVGRRRPRERRRRRRARPVKRVAKGSPLPKAGLRIANSAATSRSIIFAKLSEPVGRTGRCGLGTPVPPAQSAAAINRAGTNTREGVIGTSLEPMFGARPSERYGKKRSHRPDGTVRDGYTRAGSAARLTSGAARAARGSTGARSRPTSQRGSRCPGTDRGRPPRTVARSRRAPPPSRARTEPLPHGAQHQVLAVGRGRPAPAARRIGGELAQRERAGHGVAELAHVARPRVGLAARSELAGERGRSAPRRSRAEVAARAAARRPCALAQRRQLDARRRRGGRRGRRGSGRACDLAIEVAARRGEDAHVDARSQRSPPTRRTSRALERAEELRLQRQIEIANLVDEQRAAVRLLEDAACAPRSAPVNAPRSWPKSSRLDEARRHGGAVEDDERALGARRRPRGAPRRATSLPVPVSPSMTTGHVARARAARRAGRAAASRGSRR